MTITEAIAEIVRLRDEATAGKRDALTSKNWPDFVIWGSREIALNDALALLAKVK